MTLRLVERNFIADNKLGVDMYAGDPHRVESYLVTVSFGFVGTFHLNADIVSLFLGQRGQFGADFVEMHGVLLPRPGAWVKRKPRYHTSPDYSRFPICASTWLVNEFDITKLG